MSKLIPQLALAAAVLLIGCVASQVQASDAVFELHDLSRFISLSLILFLWELVQFFVRLILVNVSRVSGPDNSGCRSFTSHSRRASREGGLCPGRRTTKVSICSRSCVFL